MPVLSKNNLKLHYLRICQISPTLNATITNIQFPTKLILSWHSQLSPQSNRFELGRDYSHFLYFTLSEFKNEDFIILCDMLRCEKLCCAGSRRAEQRVLDRKRQKFPPRTIPNYAAKSGKVVFCWLILRTFLWFMLFFFCVAIRKIMKILKHKKRDSVFLLWTNLLSESGKFRVLFRFLRKPFQGF